MNMTVGQSGEDTYVNKTDHWPAKRPAGRRMTFAIRKDAPHYSLDCSAATCTSQEIQVPFWPTFE